MDVNQLNTFLEAVIAAKTAGQETAHSAIRQLAQRHHQQQQQQVSCFATQPLGINPLSTSPGTLTSNSSSNVTQQQPQQQNNQQKIEELRQKTRGHVEQAISNIPLEQKAAYLEALEKAPEVVQDETDPMLFVRRCAYNIWDAANRLCLYWHERKKLFGDRAFLPLTLTEDGALSKQAILGLQAGFPAILPNNAKSGQKVVFFDRRKFIPLATREDRLKANFYLHKILAQDETTQVEGVIALVLLITPRFGEVDFKFVQKTFYLCTRVFPTKTSFHLLQKPPQAKVGKSAIVSQITSTAQKVAIENGVEDCRVYTGQKPGELLKILRTMGLSDDGIPDSVGGKWQFETFFRWCRDQEAQERRIYREILTPSTPSEPATSTSLDAEERLRRKRLSDVIHSRRKRERQKQGLVKLKDEVSKQKSENAKLKAQNTLLKDLVTQAGRIVQSLPHDLLTANGDSKPPAAQYRTRTSDEVFPVSSQRPFGMNVNVSTEPAVASPGTSAQDTAVLQALLSAINPINVEHATRLQPPQQQLGTLQTNPSDAVHPNSSSQAHLLVQQLTAQHQQFSQSASDLASTLGEASTSEVQLASQIQSLPAHQQALLKLMLQMGASG